MTTDHPRPLPVGVRPVVGESVESYVRRLARANHLKPSYLRRYLCGSPGGHAKPQLERLAAVSGRPVATLEHVFATRTPPRRKPTPNLRRRARSRAAIYQAIRRDAGIEDLSIRALSARHHVHRRTVREALANPKPPLRKPLPPRTSLVDPLKPVIDALIVRNLTIAQIWDHLLDTHDAEMSYSTLGDYIAKRRPELVPRDTIR